MPRGRAGSFCWREEGRPVSSLGWALLESAGQARGARTAASFLVLPLIPTARGHQGLEFPSSLRNYFLSQGGMQLAWGNGRLPDKCACPLATLTREGLQKDGKPPFQPPTLQHTHTLETRFLSFTYLQANMQTRNVRCAREDGILNSQ